MKRMLQTLAVAAVLVGVLALASLAHAGGAEACKDPRLPHITKILSDLEKMKADPGWEATVIQPMDKGVPRAAELYFSQPMVFVAPEIKKRILTNAVNMAVVSTPGKPNTLLIWFDKDNCFVGMGALPNATWKQFIEDLTGKGI